MRILRAGDYRRMPWKNGGGVTTEIIVAPEGAALDNFGWRVSMAHVASDGPFSLFPGIDRTLAVLSGSGIRLRVDGLGETALTQAAAPFAFPADVVASADLIDGPITDLNVMSRRGVLRHALTRTTISQPLRIAAPADALLLLTQGGGATIKAGMALETLADGDSVLLTAGDAEAVLTPASTLTLYRAEFRYGSG